MACSLSLAIKTDMEEMSFKIGDSFYKLILANRYSSQQILRTETLIFETIEFNTVTRTYF
jgi:hypothetical protein